MFENMVVSSNAFGRWRGVRLFLITSILYCACIAAGIAASIALVQARLRDASDTTAVIPLVQFPVHQPQTGPGSQGGPGGPKDARPPGPMEAVRQAPHSFSGSENPSAAPPLVGVPSYDLPGFGGFGDGKSIGTGTAGFGYQPGPGCGGSLIPSPPPKARLEPQAEPATIRVSQKVLTGRAIERAIPVYPPMAVKIRLHGSVTVEVVISEDGRVESARALDGHVLLKNAAVEAARRWRFRPTTIGDKPVRTTGAITFVFTLDQ